MYTTKKTAPEKNSPFNLHEQDQGGGGGGILLAAGKQTRPSNLSSKLKETKSNLSSKLKETKRFFSVSLRSNTTCGPGGGSNWPRQDC